MSFRTFNISEVSAYLHIAQTDVQQLVQRQEIPFEKKGDRIVFYRNEIDSWASRRILGLTQTRLTTYHHSTSAKAHDLSRSHAIVTELLKNDFIKTEMQTRTKPSVIRFMSELAAKTGMVNDSEDLLHSLEEREKICSTAISDGIALLHPRHHEPFMFEDSFIVLGKTAHHVPFGAPDGKMTDIFLLICCQDDRIHLHVLARICMMCKQTKMLQEIRNSEDSQSIADCVKRSEDEIIKNARKSS